MQKQSEFSTHKAPVERLSNQNRCILVCRQEVNNPKRVSTAQNACERTHSFAHSLICALTSTRIEKVAAGLALTLIRTSQDYLDCVCARLAEDPQATGWTHANRSSWDAQKQQCDRRRVSTLLERRCVRVVRQTVAFGLRKAGEEVSDNDRCVV